MARTQKEAINWVKSSVGKGFDTDGMYGFQCKDLVNAYANYLGLPVKAGNAKSLDSPSRGWKKVKLHNQAISLLWIIGFRVQTTVIQV